MGIFTSAPKNFQFMKFTFIPCFFQPRTNNRHDKAGKCLKVALNIHARTQTGGTVYTHALGVELRF